MRNYRTIKTIVMLTAMSGITTGCQSSFMVSQSSKHKMQPQPSKCQKMLQVAQRFEEQGLLDQARHVYSLIPQDSTCIIQAKQSLAKLGTNQQPAKINIASQNAIKRIPVVDASNLSEQVKKAPEAELLIKNDHELLTTPPLQTNNTPHSDIKVVTNSADPLVPNLIPTITPEPGLTPICVPAPDSLATVSKSKLEDTTSQLVVCPSCESINLHDKVTLPRPVISPNSNHNSTLALGVEELFYKPALEHELNEELREYRELLSSGNMTLKEWNAIGELGSDAALLLVDIEQAMHYGEVEQQLHAAFCFYKITGTIDPAKNRLRQALRSTDANEVGLAAYYLGEMGTNALEFSKELKDLIANGNSIVRVYAAEASIKISGPKPEFQLALCQAAEDDQGSARLLAIVSLAQVGMQLDPHVAESLFHLISDDDQDVADQSMMTLALLRPVEPRFKELVYKIMQDKSHPLCNTAQVAWECINDTYVTNSQ